MKKTGLLILLILLLMFITQTNAYAEQSNESDTASLYRQQADAVDADNIIDALPDYAKDKLSQVGIDDIGNEAVNKISMSGFVKAVISTAEEAFKSEGTSSAALFGIILLCALSYGMESSLSSTSGLVDIVGTLFTCTAITVPIVGLIESAAFTIKISSDFMLIYIPVMAGLMISSGQAVTAGSYYTLMMAAGQGISQLCSKIIIPVLNIFFGVSAVSAISKDISLNGFCNLFYKTVKWVLAFIMGIFSSLLAIQSILGMSADNASSKAVRFAIKSFIPVVGGALSDAYLSVASCVKLLKSGIGIVAIIGSGFIYLPVLFKCIFWLALLNICKAFGEIFGLKSHCTLFDTSAKVLSTLIAIILCCMAIFIISTTIVLLLGGT